MSSYQEQNEYITIEYYAYGGKHEMEILVDANYVDPDEVKDALEYGLESNALTIGYDSGPGCIKLGDWSYYPTAEEQFLHETNKDALEDDNRDSDLIVFDGRFTGTSGVVESILSLRDYPILDEDTYYQKCYEYHQERVSEELTDTALEFMYDNEFYNTTLEHGYDEVGYVDSADIRMVETLAHLALGVPVVEIDVWHADDPLEYVDETTLVWNWHATIEEAITAYERVCHSFGFGSYGKVRGYIRESDHPSGSATEPGYELATVSNE